MAEDIWLFIVVGFVAQLIDGSLGMGYGVICSITLLASGVPPASTSASVHLAKLFTTATAGASHILHQNVDWPLFRKLALAGIVGGCMGAYILTSIDATYIKPFVVVYLGILGVLIIIRAFVPPVPHAASAKFILPLGGIGGLLDAIGGGGWGPVVTSTLLGTGAHPRYVIGTVNSTEFLVTVAVSLSFILALVTGHWDETGGILDHATSVAGLVLGGLCAAPLAGYLLKCIPVQRLKIAVGILIVVLAAWQAYRLF